MAKEQSKRSENRYVWRDSETGRFMDVVVADPAVRPKKTTVEKIRKAVREVAKRSASSSAVERRKKR
jgi:hypothetical protein